MATEEELAAVRPRLFGLIAEERIKAVDIARPPRELLDSFFELTDLASAVSDALDELGLGGGAAASTLAPIAAGQRIVGPAITIRYVPQGGSVAAFESSGEAARLADRDLYNVGQPGDVAIFDCGGHVGSSVMGGLSAAWAKRVGIAGCIVDGAVRDVQGIREEGVAVWARGFTPVSGKHRMEAIEINGSVTIAGMAVNPGDVVVADDTGVCVIPASAVEAVRDIAIEAERAERDVVAAISSGATPEEVARILRPERW
jgi:4-hydroxy-4-methyl-2-oxoglutarate aldolase